MKKLTLCSLLFALAISLGGCKKVIPTPQDPNSLLVDKKWKVIAYTQDGQDKLHEYYLPCQLDDLNTFASDGKAYQDDAEDRCSTTEPKVKEAGTWSMTGKKITATDTNFGITATYDVIELTEKTLKLSLINPFIPGMVLTATYTAQ
ncbi:MAG TPA: lipocalin family protein [Pedobacter sp.]|uniref:lipocalin family protein n=1 Tax=Pedobacter sp. TaxID=1411316 RepID=UPI002CFAA559|nr:lipocalin family protein [Pedobacter sp.]HMI05753.1 lipocalin family protein [Pedobacter sp.]